MPGPTTGEGPGPVPATFLHELLDRAAEDHPDRPALHMEEATITFAALARRTRQVASAAAELGPPGARIAMVGPNHPAWVTAYYGVPRAGRILLFLNHRLAVPELTALLERAGATAVIGPAEQVAALAEGPGHHGRRHLALDHWETLVDEAPESATTDGLSTDGGEPAWLLYTSGTTGRPKGALLSHRSLLAAVAVLLAERPVPPDAVSVLAFPLCHVAGYNVLAQHAQGRPVVLLPRFEARAFVEATRRWGATMTTLTATMVAALVEELETHPEARLSLASLQRLAFGAAPMPAALVRRLRRQLDVALSQGYGMTELAGNAVFLGPEDYERGLAGEEDILRSAGHPGPGVEVRVVDDELADVPPGATGEILVRGRQVMSGYFDDPEATAATLVDGWLRTGDLGRFEPEGRLAVVDRKKDVIVTGGENVASREVEDAILGCCPEVHEVAVVGVPDIRWGENVCAVVVPVRGQRIDPPAILRRLRGQLAGFKLPRHVVVVDELPKNATGKVQKQELRTWLSTRPELTGERLA